MQLRAVGRRASTGSLTVLGDIAQGTTPWATASWADALTHLGKPDSHVGGPSPRLPRARQRDHVCRAPPPLIAPGLAAPSRCVTTRAG